MSKVRQPTPPSVGSATVSAYYSAESYAIDNSYGYLMRRVQASLLRHIDKRFSPYELTALQWGPLLLLSQGKGNTAASLARALDMDTGAMTRMLDRLQAKKLLRRTRSEHDRRLQLLELTGEGERIVAQIPQVIADVLNLHLRGFTHVETRQLVGFLRRLLDNGNGE